MYEGTPDTPHKGRIFELIAKYKVSILYTAPTLIRTWMKWGDEFPQAHNLNSLRLLGSVGEPINPEAWMWYREVIGSNRCPIVDTWWQTETGAIMISPLPGVTATKPGSAMRPLPGISGKVVDDNAKEVGLGHGGYLILDKPWPSMLRGIWGEEQRYKETYWSRFDGVYFAGDGAKWRLPRRRKEHQRARAQAVAQVHEYVYLLNRSTVPVLRAHQRGCQHLHQPWQSWRAVFHSH
jgi:acetyl-CoA synthetase